LVSFGPPRRFWTSDGQSHLRGEVDSGTVSGDLRGTYSEVFNANFHGEEQATTFGSFTITTSSVTWQGVARGKITRGISTGTFVGHGTDGSKIMGGLHLDWASVLYLERRDPRLAEASHIGRPTCLLLVAFGVEPALARIPHREWHMALTRRRKATNKGHLIRPEEQKKAIALRPFPYPRRLSRLTALPVALVGTLALIVPSAAAGSRGGATTIRVSVSQSNAGRRSGE